MKKVIYLGLLLLLVLSIFVTSCGKTETTTATTSATTITTSQADKTTTQPQQVYKLTFGTLNPSNDSENTDVTRAWFNWLEKESGGRLQMNLIADNQAAAPADYWDAAKNGVIDIALQLSDFMAGRLPVSDVVSLPSIFYDPNGITESKVLKALYEKYPEIQAEYADMQLLFIHGSSFSQLHTSKKLVKTMADMKGMVIGAPSTTLSDVTKLMGGTPENFGTEDLDAMQKGISEGEWGSYAKNVVFGFMDVVNYTTDISLTSNYWIFVMNKNSFNNLPADLQELFTGENAWKIGELYAYNDYLSELKNKQKHIDAFKARGNPEPYVLPADEKAILDQTLQPIVDQWIKDVTPKIGEAKARAILEDTIKFSKQYSLESLDLNQYKQTLCDWGAPGYQN